MIDRLIELLVPPLCTLCQRRLDGSAQVFCPSCEAALAACVPDACAACGVPSADGVRCARCRERAFRFARARAPFRYHGLVRRAVQAFKYQRRSRVGRWLAVRMAALARQDLPLDGLVRVAPVPQHWLKARLRGTEPAAELARSVARSLEARYDHSLLRRRRWTSTQTKLTASARIDNVRGAFVAHRRRVSGSTVLLIDDVFTSGATADACAAALLEAGARAVYVLTAASTPSELTAGPAA